jgi:hypothetical protein
LHAVKYEAAITLTTLTQNPATAKGEFFIAFGSIQGVLDLADVDFILNWIL